MRLNIAERLGRISRRAWIACGVGAFALILASLFIPGWGLRLAVTETLRRQGMAQVNLIDADLAILMGRVGLHRLSAQKSDGAPLGLGDLSLVFNWTPLLDRKVSLERVALSGLSISVRQDQGRWSVNGVSLPQAEAGPDTGTPWGFGAESLAITDSRLAFSDGVIKLDIHVDELHLEGLRSWDPAVPLRFSLTGSLNGSRIKASGNATPFAATPGAAVSVETEGIDLAAFAPLLGLKRLEGRVAAKLGLVMDGGSTTASGTVGASDLFVATEPGAMKLAATGVSFAAEPLTWDAAKGRLEWKGSLGLDGARVEGEDLLAQPQKARWQGRVLATGLGHGPLALKLEGHLDDEGASVATGPIRYAHGRASATGQVEIGTGAGALAITGNISLNAEDLVVRDPTGQRELAAMRRMDARDLRLEPGRPTLIGRIEASKVSALREAGSNGYPWRVEAETIKAEGLAVAPDGGVSLDGLAFDSLTLRITREARGFVGLDAIPSPQPKDGPRTAAEPPPIRLGRVEIGGKSRILFADRTLAQAVRLGAEDVKLTVANLDSTRPERDSTFDLKTRIGSATITANGAARPFEPTVTGRIKGRINNLELPPLSPYAAEALGVDLHTGHFDGELQVAVEKGALDGNVNLVLSNLFIAPPDPNAPIVRHSKMPIATVLNLLRDSEDRIKLAVPLGGNLSDPTFDISDAVAKAVGGALRSTALTTLKVVFPVAMIIELADADESAGLALEPVWFPAGGSGLDDAASRRLDAVAELMRQRPGLKLSLCPVSSARSDWPVLLAERQQDSLGVLYRLQKLVDLEAKPDSTPPDEDRLNRLAQRRSDAVKSYLAETRGIKLDRLFGCRPAADEGTEARPRVELLL